MDKVLETMPGPGNYAQSSLFGQSGISVTISGKEERRERNTSPGPGTYEESAAHSATKDRVRSYKFGDSKSHRGELVGREASSSPGPGMYDGGKKFGEGVQTVT